MKVYLIYFQTSDYEWVVGNVKGSLEDALTLVREDKNLECTVVTSVTAYGITNHYLSIPGVRLEEWEI